MHEYVFYESFCSNEPSFNIIKNHGYACAYLPLVFFSGDLEW